MKRKPNQSVNVSHAKLRVKPKQFRHGPEPERLKINGDWKGAIDVALTKKRPPEGWPTS